MATSTLLISLTLLAQPAAPDSVADSATDLKAQVATLVKQLDAEKSADRDAAEKALLELGPDALNVLPAVTNRTPAEVKVRLERVRTTLEKATAESFSKPTTVTLKGQMSVVEALEAVAKQTGNQVAAYENRSGEVNVDFKDTLYWEALDQILDQAELDINPFGGRSNALVLTARGNGQADRHGRAAYQGVFRFEPLRIESRRDLRNPAVDGMILTITATWEPRISPIALRLPVDSISTTDDAGGDVGTNGQGALTASAESGMSAIELRIPLQLPDRGARTIKSLKGTLNALVPGRVETFEFDSLRARDAQLTRAGVTVTFERLRKNQELYEVRMNVRFDEAANALESHRNWIFDNKAIVVDTEGRELENVAIQSTRQGENEAGVAYLFELPNGPDGCKFVYSTPAMILQLPVEFELTDIELP